MSIEQRLKDLEAFRRQVQSGMMPQRTALGPGSLQKSAIKSGSIDAKLLNVTTLESVSASTGDLSVSGDLTIGPSGRLVWGASAEHSIDQNVITFTNAGLTASAGRIKYVLSGSPDYLTDIVGYNASTLYPVAVMRAHRESDNNTGLMGWIGVGADFAAGAAAADINVRDTGGVVRASASYDHNGLTQTITRNAAGQTKTRYVANDTGLLYIVSYDASASEVAKLTLTAVGQIHARVTSGGSFAVIDNSAPRTMLEIFPGGDINWNFADAAGATEFNTYRSSGIYAFGWRSNGVLLTGLNDATGGAGAYVRRLPIVYDNSGTPTTGYLRIYAS